MRESCGLKVNTTLCRRKVLFCAGSSIELHDCLGSLLPRKRHLTHPIAGAGPRSSFKAKRRRKTETRHRSCAPVPKLLDGPGWLYEKKFDATEPSLSNRSTCSRGGTNRSTPISRPCRSPWRNSRRYSCRWRSRGLRRFRPSKFSPAPKLPQ